PHPCERSAPPQSIGHEGSRDGPHRRAGSFLPLSWRRGKLGRPPCAGLRHQGTLCSLNSTRCRGAPISPSLHRRSIFPSDCTCTCLAAGAFSLGDDTTADGEAPQIWIGGGIEALNKRPIFADRRLDQLLRVGSSV